MKTGVLGTGMVGAALSERLAELGHEVMIGTRDPRRIGEKLTRKNEAIRVGTFAQAAAFGQVVFHATNGATALEALEQAGQANLAGKVLVDVSNPLDFTQGMPPSLTVSNTDSLGEQIQRAFPQAKVVKTLNTVTAQVMAYPRQTADGDHHVFVSGNDPAAKEQVAAILKDFGWTHIMDLGDLSSARGTEMYLPLWLRLWDAMGTGMFNIKVVK